MAEMSTAIAGPTTEELDHMHHVYRQGGLDRVMEPHIVYPEPNCPHASSGQTMLGIDFWLEDHGRAVHDA